MPPRPLLADLPEQGVITGTSPVAQVLATNYALPWHLIVKNESGGDLNAVRVRSRTHEKGPWSPWQSVASGLPIAAGATLSLVERDVPSQAIEVELTAASTGVASLWLVGV
jgi:hypothetical protein